MTIEKTNAVIKRQAVEKRIVRAVVKAALAAGWSILIDNGDSAIPLYPQTATFILSQLFATDEEYLVLSRNMERAWVRFVYGNDGWDVICDYSTNLDKCFMPEVDKLVDALSN